jgi:hypothetical protein
MQLTALRIESSSSRILKFLLTSFLVVGLGMEPRALDMVGAGMSGNTETANAGIAAMLRQHAYLPNPNDLPANAQHLPLPRPTILPNVHPPPTSLFQPQDV